MTIVDHGAFIAELTGADTLGASGQ